MNNLDYIQEFIFLKFGRNKNQTELIESVAEELGISYPVAYKFIKNKKFTFTPFVVEKINNCEKFKDFDYNKALRKSQSR